MISKNNTIARILLFFMIIVLAMTDALYADTSATIIYSGDMKGYVEPCPG